MKGKNAGKRFHRRSRLQLAPPRLIASEGTIFLRRDLDKSQKECRYSSEEQAKLSPILVCPSNAILTGLPVRITNPSMEIMNECETRALMIVPQSSPLMANIRLCPHNEQTVSTSPMAFYGPSQRNVAPHPLRKPRRYVCTRAPKPYCNSDLLYSLKLTAAILLSCKHAMRCTAIMEIAHLKHYIICHRLSITSRD